MRESKPPKNQIELDARRARRIWLARQGLLRPESFGRGKSGALAAIRRLGYVQIDTIHVVERAHHHILRSRVPDYRPSDLRALQTTDRAIFEYWTHALSFIPIEDFRYFVRSMRRHELEPSRWFSMVTSPQKRALLRRIRKEGPISIRDIEEDAVEKDHEWASRKPSKRALEHLFYSGRLAVRTREGMTKVYDLVERHFGWERRPAAATRAEEARYRLDRELGAQGVVTLDSATYLDRELRAEVEREIARRVRAGTLLAARAEGLRHPAFLRPEDEALSVAALEPREGYANVLSPFDPIVIQRARTAALFGFEYLLECYVPAPKRRYGYFCLPVLHEDRFVARIDAKADRGSKRLLIRSWHWEKTAKDRRAIRPAIEAALERLEEFQFIAGATRP
jgi:uncharacterized protein YcaQ